MNHTLSFKIELQAGIHVLVLPDGVCRPASSQEVEMYNLLTPSMSCKACKKILGGGFKRKEGGYKCADCLMVEFNIESAQRCNDEIEAAANIGRHLKPNGRRYKEAFNDLKSEICKMRAFVEYGSKQLSEALNLLNKPVDVPFLLTPSAEDEQLERGAETV